MTSWHNRLIEVIVLHIFWRIWTSICSNSLWIEIPWNSSILSLYTISIPHLISEPGQQPSPWVLLITSLQMIYPFQINQWFTIWHLQFWTTFQSSICLRWNEILKFKMSLAQPGQPSYLVIQRTLNSYSNALGMVDSNSVIHGFINFILDFNCFYADKNVVSCFSKITHRNICEAQAWLHPYVIKIGSLDK